MVGDAWVVCMRVQSERPKPMAGGETGWLHPIGDAPKPPPKPERPATILDVKFLMDVWRKDRRGTRLDELSSALGVTIRALESLECTRAPYHNTWAFPMRYGDNSYCGIRLRNDKGEKWAERGSHSGLFIPQCEPTATVLITEGPTDTAAALTLGYYALGRPSCCGGLPHVQTALQRIQAKRAVIVADLDDPGLRGAKTLQEHLPVPTSILVCPTKDIRSFVNGGGDRDMMEAMIGQLLWSNP